MTTTVTLVTVPLGDPCDNAAKGMARFLVSDSSAPPCRLFSPQNPPMLNKKTIRTSIIGRLPLPLAAKKGLFLAGLSFLRGDLLHTVISPRPRLDSLLAHTASNFHGTIQTFPVVVDEETFDRNAYFGNVFVVFSEYSRSILKKNGFQDVRVAPIPVDTTRFSLCDLPDGNEFRLLVAEEYSRPETFLTLISAAKTVYASCPHVRFVIAARLKEAEDKKKRALVLKTISKNGLQDFFEIHETVADMPGLIRSCHASVYPVQRVFNKLDRPLFLLESLAMGRPIVIPDTAPLNENWEERMGIRFAPNNSEKLAEALMNVISRREYLESTRAERSALIKQHHSPEKFQRFFRNLYNEVLR